MDESPSQPSGCPSLSRTRVLLAAVAAGLVAAPAALGHGTLIPAAAPAGTVQDFELVVPNDRFDAGIVGVTLELPPGTRLESSEGIPPRWTVASDDRVVTWSGGPIASGNAETFAFRAELPDDAGTAEFTLREGYDDGDAAPFPIPVTVSEVAGSGGSANGLALAALLVALGALVLAGTALVVALRGRPARPS